MRFKKSLIKDCAANMCYADSSLGARTSVESVLEFVTKL
jgi:hypothetical protein